MNSGKKDFPQEKFINTLFEGAILLWVTVDLAVRAVAGSSSFSFFSAAAAATTITAAAAATTAADAAAIQAAETNSDRICKGIVSKSIQG